MKRSFGEAEAEPSRLGSAFAVDVLDGGTRRMAQTASMRKPSRCGVQECLMEGGERNWKVHLDRLGIGVALFERVYRDMPQLLPPLQSTPYRT